MDSSLKKMLSDNKVAGVRQIVRGINGDTIRCVLIAEDTDLHIKRQLLDLCTQKNIPVLFCPSKSELGREIGIDIGCAAVGFLK